MKNLTLIKQTVVLSFIGATVLVSHSNAQALTVEEVTNPRQNNSGWVTDMADILSYTTETKLNNLITNLEQNNGAEIAVVTVPETTPADSPKAFATELFNYWGIGKAESDNGILFLVSTGDRRVEIETGYGIEAILADAQVTKIIDNKITPQYKKGNYDRGTIDGAIALIDSLNRETANSTISTQAAINSLDPKEETVSNDNNWNLLAILAGVSIVSFGGFAWLKHKGGKVFINPRQAIVSLKRQDDRDVCCAKCKEPMQKVQHVKLNKVQRIAKKIGAVSYRGYQCSDCNNPLQPYSLVAYTSNSSRYQKCSKCQEFTITSTETVSQQASYTSEGERIIRDTCNCCEYVRETTEIIPRLRHRTNPNSRSHHHNNGNRNYYNHTHSSGGGGYSGGGSSGGFGGGSSGGGGSGGDF